MAWGRVGVLHLVFHRVVPVGRPRWPAAARPGAVSAGWPASAAPRCFGTPSEPSGAALCRPRWGRGRRPGRPSGRPAVPVSAVSGPSVPVSAVRPLCPCPVLAARCRAPLCPSWRPPRCAPPCSGVRFGVAVPGIARVALGRISWTLGKGGRCVGVEGRTPLSEVPEFYSPPLRHEMRADCHDKGSGREFEFPPVECGRIEPGWTVAVRLPVRLQCPPGNGGKELFGILGNANGFAADSDRESAPEGPSGPAVRGAREGPPPGRGGPSRTGGPPVPLLGPQAPPQGRRMGCQPCNRKAGPAIGRDRGRAPWGGVVLVPEVRDASSTPRAAGPGRHPASPEGRAATRIPRHIVNAHPRAQPGKPF